MNVVETARGLSRQTKALLVGIVLIAALGASGLLRADSDLEITSEEAVEIAESRLDFDPALTSVRLLRQGIDLRPVWAVSFSTPGDQGNEFEELLVVQIDAETSEIVAVSRG